MTQLKVLISGGGVAGTALAFWLTRLGHAVTLVEWFPTLRTTGLQIDLRGPGIEVLRRMGLEAAFRAHAAPEEGMQMIDRAGRRRAYMPANKTGKGSQGITSEFEIMRGDLTRLIADTTGPSGARYIFGTSIARFTQDGSGVEVAFKNGNAERFDLLVGADGVHSSTRTMLFGSDADTNAFRPLGESAAYMTLARPIAPGERYVGQMYLATERRAILLRRHSPSHMQLYLLLNRDDERLTRAKRADIPAEKEAFTEIFRGAGWRTEEMLEALAQADDFYCERVGVVELPAWSKGRVALLGDAAYGPGGSGMGTTCALVGAYVLAGEIGRRCGGESRDGLVEEALKGYEDSFRPYMTHVQRGLGAAPGWLMPSGEFGIAILHWVLVVLRMLWYDPIVSLFLKEKGAAWQLPEYAELTTAQAKAAEAD